MSIEDFVSILFFSAQCWLAVLQSKENKAMMLQGRNIWPVCGLYPFIHGQLGPALRGNGKSSLNLFRR